MLLRWWIQWSTCYYDEYSRAHAIMMNTVEHMLLRWTHYLLQQQISLTSGHDFRLVVVVNIHSDSTLFQTTKFWAWPSFKDCRRQNKCDFKTVFFFFLEIVENIGGKAENSGYQHFLLFPQYFQETFFTRVIKSLDCVVKSYRLMITNVFSFSNKMLTVERRSFFDRHFFFKRLQPRNLN